MRTRSTRLAAPWLTGVLAGVLVPLALVVALVAAPVDAAPGDSVRVTGWDFVTELTSPITAGDDDNRLDVRVTLGAALTDGSVSVDLPRSAWVTPLSAVEAGDSLLLSDVGAVAARPAVPPQEAASDECVGTDGTTLQALVLASPDVQSVLVPGVTCAAGSHLTIRVNNVRAPRAGRYRLPVRVSDAGGLRFSTRATVRVDPAPRTRLELRLSSSALVVGQPFSAAVVALRPNGSIDRGYRGTVAFDESETACGSAFPSDETFAFTAADAGVKLLILTFGGPDPLDSISVRAVDRSARTSGEVLYTVSDTDPESGPITCAPVPFH